jgi:hypothetical protein
MIISHSDLETLYEYYYLYKKFLPSDKKRRIIKEDLCPLWDEDLYTNRQILPIKRRAQSLLYTENENEYLELLEFHYDLSPHLKEWAESYNKYVNEPEGFRPLAIAYRDIATRAVTLYGNMQILRKAKLLPKYQQIKEIYKDLLAKGCLLVALFLRQTRKVGRVKFSNVGKLHYLAGARHEPLSRGA